MPAKFKPAGGGGRLEDPKGARPLPPAESIPGTSGISQAF